MSITALGSNQHPKQRSPGFFNWDTAARPEDDQLHHMSRLRMNGGIPQLSHILRGVHLVNFTRLEITRQRGTIIKEKELSTKKPQRKSCMWVQRRTG
jgi:hypothetical protein